LRHGFGFVDIRGVERDKNTIGRLAHNSSGDDAGVFLHRVSRH
jgi:hypothetical protein